MISLPNINTIAKYESKILFRNWFFRILMILSLVILGFMNGAMVMKKTSMNWSFIALSSFQPYVILMMFNLVQAVLAIFLASDYVRRDKSMDTSKVVYSRAVSNTEYIFGKTLGILYVFLLANILLMVETLIFNLTSPLISLHPLAYLYYPLLISLPTLIFIIGLSYLFMTLTRNQAITFILLVAYVALTSFYLGKKLNYLLDFMAYRVPMAMSDFIGFGNLNEILIHRGIYVLLGLGFIFLAIRFMERLPQNNKINLMLALAIVFLLGAIGLSTKYIADIKVEKNLREKAISLNEKYGDEAIVDIDHYDLKFIHKSKNIDASVHVKFHNGTSAPIDRYIFTLNHGFKISEIKRGGLELPYSQDMHVIAIDPGKVLAPGQSDSLLFVYKGSPDDRTTYLDVDTANLEEQFRVMMINVDKKSSILEEDHVILTQESNYYPTAGVGYSLKNRFKINRDFSTFNIDIKTQPSLTVITQGDQVFEEDGQTKYTVDIPIPQVSITIGKYEKLSVTIDSVEYALFRKKDHNYWTQHFTELGDTIEPVLKELITDFERKLGLEYPYNKMYLVEAPIQFAGMPRLNTVAWEYSQPEIVMIPENGFMLWGADLRQMNNFGNRRRNNEEESEKEKQVNNFKRGFNATLTNGNAFMRSPNSDGDVSNYFSLFPLYYTHTYYLKSDELPIINLAFESYYLKRIKGEEAPWSRGNGLTGQEKANIYLQKGSFEYYLENEQNRDRIVDIISLKGNYLFTMFRYNKGIKAFDEMLQNFMTDNQNKIAVFEDFSGLINETTDLDVENFLQDWYSNDQVPTFAMNEGEYYTVMKDNKEFNQVIFRITNKSEVDGLFTITFAQNFGRFWGGGRNAGTSNEDEFIYSLKANETKEIGVALTNGFRNYEVNTIISNNLPLNFERETNRFEQRENGRFFDGELVVDKPVQYLEDKEIVVDNIDEGFSVFQPKSNKLVRNLFEQESDGEFEYVYFNSWRVQPQWRHFVNSDAYGNVKHTAYYCKVGEGDFKAIWQAPLEYGNGKYEIYTYLNQEFVNGGRRFGRRGRGRDEIKGEYIYTVDHDDGTDEIPLVLEELENGWNYLGDFYFSGDSAKVSLSNKGEDPMIITADAIKWVKK